MTTNYEKLVNKEINEQEEKQTTQLVFIENCHKCPKLKAYACAGFKTDTLYKCDSDTEQIITPTTKDLYDKCPFDHLVEKKVTEIRHYVLKHNTGPKDPYVEIEDWSQVGHEMDGNNPHYEDALTVAIAYYDNDKEKEIVCKYMYKLYKALENLKPYVPKKIMYW